ncbi:MAG: lytic murein transglycosylase [Gammaproteobacteria bacterium]|nr:lytic murein transglycosylase [Gammaproteobacteria bacterium]
MSLALAALVCGTVLAVPLPAPLPRAGPTIEIGDVYRFYRIYEAAGGHPTAGQLQEYLDHGSPGLKHLAAARNVTAARMAEAIEKRPELYSGARRCLPVLPRVRDRLRASLVKLAQLYPEARFPPVTIAVGRGKPVAIGGPGHGVQVGLEALCASDTLNADVAERFVHVIAHEYAHVQQLIDDDHPTVLEGSLLEGAAEFTAELVSGEVSNTNLSAFARGRERDIETQFVRDEESLDTSRWLYNGPGKPDWPQDLGYWVGYRICKSYYQHAADRRHALADILEMADPPLFVAKSGWYPGIVLK